MPTPPLSKAEREILREAFRRAAWLEPSKANPTDPNASEWAAFEDDALFKMVPAFEAIMEARAEATGEPKAADAPEAGESETTRRPGESLGDFLTDMAAPFVGEVAGFIVGGNWGTPTSRTRPKTSPAADLLTGLIPTVTDLIGDLLDPKPDSKPDSKPRPSTAP